MEHIRSAEEDRVRVQFRLSRAEYARGVRYYLRKSHYVSWVQAVLIGLIFGAVAVLSWFMGRLTPLNTFLLVLLVLVAAYGLYLYLAQPGRIFDKNPALGREVAFVFTREDIARQDEEAGQIFDWNLKKLWRGREFYYLFSNQDNSYILLPRRAFAAPEDETLFEALAWDANPDLVFKAYG